MATPTFLKFPTQKLRRLKYPLYQLHLHVIGIRHDFNCLTMQVGDPDGGWFVAPKHLERTSIVYSFGVGNNVSFDCDLIKHFGVTVHAFDPTPRCAKWVSSQQLPPEFAFHDIGIAAFDGTQQFFQPKSKSSYHFTPVKRYASQGNGHAKDSVEAPVRRLATIMRELGHDRIDLLKLDIDGGEYDVIDDIIESGIRPRQLLVEFHHMFSTIPMKKTLGAVHALRNAGYGILQISPRTYEYSFMLREDGADLR